MYTHSKMFAHTQNVPIINLQVVPLNCGEKMKAAAKLHAVSRVSDHDKLPFAGPLSGRTKANWQL